MYKYKQTTDVEIGDLVVWTDISKYHDTLTKDKVYQVTNHPDQNTLNVINDKGNKNSYGKGFGFKVIQTKSASEAVVGDYMYRISYGSYAFPQHTIIKITKIIPKYLYYKAEHSVLHNEVIVIAQAESNEFTLGSTTEWSLQPTIKEQPMNKTTLKLLLELLGASEEVKDATNSKFVGIITNEDEYVGYMYFDSKEGATECMAQPRMELHKLHLFEKSCVLAQKPRKVIEV